MTERWQTYFAESYGSAHSLLETAIEHWNYNVPMYHHIRQTVRPPARLLDVGCGFGFSAVYLQAFGYQVVGIDQDPKIVETARETARQLGSGATFQVADAFDLSALGDSFNLAYSMGVLEHFDRHVTVDLIREQAKVAEYILVEIPSKWATLVTPATDERFYSMNGLSAILHDAGLEVTSLFGFGDISTPAHTWVRRLLPHMVYRVLQDRVGYAMGIACIGRRQTAPH